MPRRSTSTPSRKLPDHPPLYPSLNTTSTTTPDIKMAEETFDQLYEEALSEAFASRLNALFDGSFDKAFESHFNGVYNTIIKRNFDYVFDRITERKSRMGGGDQGPSSSTSGVLGETNKPPPNALKKDYQPHDIIRRKIRHGISRDIRKEVLFRVREAVKKDLEPELRKAITREAVWDLLQESKSKNNQEQYGMPRTRLLPREPQSMTSTDDQTVMARPNKLPQPKPKDQDVMAHTTKIPTPKSKDQDVVARPTTKLSVPKGQQSKPKDDQNSTSGTPKLPDKGHDSKLNLLLSAESLGGGGGEGRGQGTRGDGIGF